MSTVEEIERAIEDLTQQQVEELKAWLFDREIGRDASNGTLDPLIAEASSEAR